MPNSYVRIWVHAVWATKYRNFYIHLDKEKPIYNHMYEQFIKMGCPVRVINGMQDHVHCLFLLNPKFPLDQVIKQVKGSTSYFVNKNNLIPEHFKWQDGFLAKAVGDEGLPKLHSYIRNQKRRHGNQLKYKPQITSQP